MSGERERHTYAFQQLQVRDELVFKSLVRALDHKTRHTWTYLNEPGADLVIAGGGDHGSGSDWAPHGPGSRVALRIGGCLAGTLGLPLRVGEVLDQLDRAGRTLDIQRAHSYARASSALSRGARLALGRWPDVQFLGLDRRYLKLAALLTRHPRNVGELAAVSGVPGDVCQSFADALLSSGFASLTADPVMAAKPGAAVPQGLLTRIRARLGLLSGSSSNA